MPSKNYFKTNETKCKCGKCSGDITDEMREFANNVREYFGSPLICTSGYRCVSHNKSVNGASSSQHLLGNAMDFSLPSGAERFKFVMCVMAVCADFEMEDCRLFVYRNFIHLDMKKGAGFQLHRGI